MLRRAAAATCLVYVAIQAFQEYVFRALPEPATPADALALGAHPLNLARSILMLAAMFGLVFIYGVVIWQRRDRPVLAAFTFLAFLLFGFLEIGLRSVELVWTQVQLPAAYAQSHDPAILDQAATFEAVQHALYLPLGFAVFLGSVLAVFLFAKDRVVQAVFAFNALRTAARQLTVYAGVTLLPSPLYDHVYLAMTVIFYVPLAYWLIAPASDGRRAGSSDRPDRSAT